MRVAGALFESLMEVVCPPKPEPSYLLVLEKAPTQEEFIRGYMNGNPYSSEEVGPLMRDVKNMICETLDMAGLVEDDYGMELLVAGRIISLSLPIRTVYERVWRANLISGQQGGGRLAEGSAEGPPMLVTYRLQGLDGEATEPMVSELEDVSAEDSSPEEEFRAATVLAEALSGGNGCDAAASSGVSLLIQQIAMLPPNAKEPSLSGLGCFGAFKAFAMRQRELVARLLHVAMYFRPCREAALREGALPKLLSSVHAGLRDLLGSAEQTPARQGGSARDLTAASSSRSTFATAEESLLLALEKLVEEAAAESFASLVARLTSSSSAAQGGPPVDSSVLLHQLAECLTGLVEAGHGNLCNILARVMPFLAAHNPSAQEALLDRFATSLDFYKLDEAAQASAGCPSQCELEYSSFLKLAEELGREGAVRPADPSSHGGAAGCASPGGSELGAAPRRAAASSARRSCSSCWRGESPGRRRSTSSTCLATSTGLTRAAGRGPRSMSPHRRVQRPQRQPRSRRPRCPAARPRRWARQRGWRSLPPPTRTTPPSRGGAIRGGRRPSRSPASRRPSASWWPSRRGTPSQRGASSGARSCCCSCTASKAARQRTTSGASPSPCWRRSLPRAVRRQRLRWTLSGRAPRRRRRSVPSARGSRCSHPWG
uniref:E3 ubiquitin-protein ligase UBR4 n=1 Tax=Tetraselmis sp. GSL018 TaxID=582737 RepID=A0A061RVU1_9CHLO